MKRNKKYRVLNKGFTLIELLAVIAIIAVISVISVTTVSRVIKSSNSTASSTSTASVKIATETYVNEFPDEISWGYDKDDTSISTDIEFACISVQMLINKGYFNKDITITDEEGNSISNDTYIMVKRDKNTYALLGTELFNEDAKCRKLVPNISFKSSDGIESGSWHNKDGFTLSVVADNDSASNFSYHLDTDIKPTTNQKKVTITGNNINTKYYAEVCSSVGICSEIIDYEVKVDTEEPVISSFVKNTNDYIDTLTLTAVFQDTGSGVSKYKITTESTLPSSGWITNESGTSKITKSKEISSNGNWYIWVYDNAGNVSNASINIQNIGTLTTKTITTGETYSQTYSSYVTLSNVKKIMSVTVDNGTVDSYSLSGTKLSYTLTGGTSKYSSYPYTCTTSPSTKAATSSKSCSCPSGGTLSGTTCSSHVVSSFSGALYRSYRCSGGKYVNTSATSTNRDCPSGTTKSFSCQSGSLSGTSCSPDGSTTSLTLPCSATCTMPSYSATCKTSYSCSSGTLSGTTCYSCSRGSLNSSLKCQDTCYQSYTYYSYVVTIKYIV